jgi:hypothetical protein
MASPQFEAMKEALAQAKQRVKMPELLDRYGIHVKGRYATCPFCQSKAKYMVRDESAHCFKPDCAEGRKVDQVGFIMKIRSMEFKDAASTLLDIAGITDPSKP